jgi:predicted RNase H-like nuclease (RuvC/YqgF family)
MNFSGLPTGTVSSGRSESSPPPDRDHVDPETRIAELERENEALRAAVEQQRRENERIVERYERLLERERNGDDTAGERSTAERETVADAGDDTAAARIARFLGIDSRE